MRRVVGGLEPARCVEVEALCDAPGPHPQLGREGRHHLEPRRRDDRAQAEFRRGSRHPGQEHGLRFLGGQAGQARPIPVDQSDPTVGAALGEDRHPGLGQCLDVAVDRPDGHFELLGQLARCHARACLQEQQDIDESAGTHRGDGTPAS